ncbi:hypothetical protein T07_3802 [Trichinella nelsoni]|uniref:Uncharacterized protein n=1 Tax=Trichinella nelsoni TaxID=6336 RepID=A0A0V0SBY3_9BILA|nr:hypothetical protein T07_3802 [Trichinella nelsoni]
MKAGLFKLKCSGKRRKGQEGVKRLHIHEPRCDICAQADPSHRSMSGGSTLGVQNGKNGGFEKRNAEETKPICAIYDEEASAEPSTSDHFLVFKQVKSMLYNYRSERFPKMPVHRQDLQIPDAFRTDLC